MKHARTRGIKQPSVNVRVCAVLLLLGAPSLGGCDHHEPTPTAPHASSSDTVRIGFVGNSLTYVNDLPGMVAALSRAAGDAKPIETESVAYGGYALEDHLAQGDAVKMIQRGGFDRIALQQGPSTLPESRENLITYARQFATIIRAAGAEPAMYGVWPEKARLYAFDAGIESYRAAADSIHGMLFPAAAVWKAAWEIDPSLPLYGPDEFHPSELGTYAAAVTLYAVVRDRSPVGLPFRLSVGNQAVTLDSLQALTVQRAAEVVTATAGRAALPR